MDDREVQVVKGALIVALMFLAGCAGVTPMEELERKALLSGDWSEVEQRERILARRNPTAFLNCPRETIAFCVDDVGRKRCGCVRDDETRTLLSWR